MQSLHLGSGKTLFRAKRRSLENANAARPEALDPIRLVL
jgi:hypothetical protein